MNIRKTITSEIEWNTIKKARADGVPMMKPQSAYGRVTQLFPKGKEACVEGNAPPAWCYGHYLST